MTDEEYLYANYKSGDFLWRNVVMYGTLDIMEYLGGVMFRQITEYGHKGYPPGKIYTLDSLDIKTYQLLSDEDKAKYL
jgi:hypothetical protein